MVEGRGSTEDASHNTVRLSAKSAAFMRETWMIPRWSVRARLIRAWGRHLSAEGVLNIQRGLCLAFLLCASNLAAAQEGARVIVGRYHNPAQGFSVRVPRGFRGVAGHQAGPERGVKIHLGEGRRIVVFGEPNSLEWENTAQAARRVIEADGSAPARTAKVHSGRLGRLAGSRGLRRSASGVLEVVVAFRPGGSPVYWARLESDGEHFPHDQTVFRKVVRSFRTEQWK